MRLGHEADRSFFDVKRPWSERKDKILAYYLEPYLAKVAQLKRPILIVDGFAGPGKFADGNIGSPLIICSKVQASQAKVPIRVKCIEADPELHARLASNLSAFSFAESVHSSFADYLPTIVNAAATHTVFLYVDPFSIDGLDWLSLQRVFDHLQKSQSSVEILLNFNASSFVRCALAERAKAEPSIVPDEEDSDEIDMPMTSSPTSQRLCAIVGGEWWQPIVAQLQPFHQLVAEVAEGFCSGLRSRFAEVGALPVRARQQHLVPKYYLIFASRHSDGLVLMNDAMAKTRGESIFWMDIFSRSDLEETLLAQSARPIARGDLIRWVIRNAFCMYEYSEIRGVIEALLRNGKLKSETGKPRINDRVRVWRVAVP